MKINANPYRFIFAGGGTGGHLYPALAVAEQIRLIKPESKILFIGTKDKLESTVVPKFGFDFKSIWISGFVRKLTLQNLLFPVKLLVSAVKSLMICFSFKPRVAIGTGAYVSGPVVWAASFLGSKVMLLEQNSYPGVTNRLLEKRADQIHVAFEDSKNYFRFSEKLHVSGNPVRVNLQLMDKQEAIKHIGLNPERKTLLVLGGSLGASSINNAVDENLEKLISGGIQIIWQTGKRYFDQYKNLENESVKVFPFFDDIENYYSACDLVIARAGATTIAELAYLGLPSVFVPSPNVAEDHQYKNAKSMVDNEAAILIKDNELGKKLVDVLVRLFNDSIQLQKLSDGIKKFSKPDAAKTIAENAIKLAEGI
ncbi:MAG: undecaprenyldiphospho-muramoylpentapeptide beta-N-acetylglucosaminyltransferase [Melioribacteraceae bacterium]|nr:undecaprenyldiphospho-muramoylpentapeptide beta-N-acetylglucosaminyltransferase [Melioribacteraceae bacterium]MCF8354524.1 undecaprenyldiphospho-muramoylpentapeptide beta-N-acetylglucosaminyltransferase [Melioribacteraceae bacterium]MCF8394293.1 undecaprenyldiphospho-muramoylpentapeptide beta-N-acetylglucosaminyltransferase [Melioribacteraceae bacterium]MCF8418193.1 undecaprenyldiphospho-muramoylpentapeptide beta-N-acetylglucosaminyltransferase [Melioribacteraceae bacterium]